MRIAIVEDEKAAADKIQMYLQRFEEEENTACDAVFFSDAINFMEDYRPVYDVVFMDVELPHMLGTDAAIKLREKDKMVFLVFITNMAQYAIKGYEVNAIDYILKPVSYYRFASMLKKLLSRIRISEKEIQIRTPGGIRRIPENSVQYVEIEDHLLLYHTEEGVIESWDTLKAAEEKLDRTEFAKISKSCIISLRHVLEVKEDIVMVAKKSFPISRRQKKDFWKALNVFSGR